MKQRPTVRGMFTVAIELMEKRVLLSGSVSGTVFNDTVGAGTNLNGDAGVAGQTVYADLGNSGKYISGDPVATTTATGSYKLSGVPTGSVIIREVLQSGQRQSYPVGSAGEHVTVGSTASTGVNFAATTAAYVSGNVKVNNLGQAGVVVYAYSSRYVTEVSTSTDAAGNFAFSSLVAGSFTLGANPPAGYVQTLPANGGSIAVTVASGGVDQGLAFGFGRQAASQLSGTVIGTTGSYKQLGNTAAKALDGNLSTYFDAPNASGSYVGLDLGVPQAINQISFAPRVGWAGRMVGGIFQGSNTADFSTGVSTLFTVTAQPAVGSYTTVNVVNNSAFRYVRYVGPTGSYCDVADIKFFGPSQFTAMQSDGTLLVSGTSGNDQLQVTMNSGDAVLQTINVSLNGLSQTYQENGVSLIAIDTFGGNDQSEVDLTRFINGSSAPATPAVSLVSGNGNDDFTINIVSGNGTDTGNVSIVAGSGTDFFSLYGTNTFFDVNAGSGSDTFNTGSYNEAGIYATIVAGNGNDTLIAGSGDVIQFNVGSGSDFIENSDSALLDGTIAGTSFQLSSQSEMLAGNVFEDVNHDGIYEAGEPLVANAPVTFYDSYSGTIDATTDSTGRFIVSFTPDPSGSAEQVTVGSYDTTLLPGILRSGIDIPSSSTTLTGKPIGTAGSYRNHGTTIANAFDNDPTTFFDGPDASGDWVGLDLGTAQIAGQLTLTPRAGYATRMVGGMIQASSTADFSSGVVTLLTIQSAPESGSFTLSLNNSTAYRYYRYIGPSNSYCDIAELVFGG